MLMLAMESAGIGECRNWRERTLLGRAGLGARRLWKLRTLEGAGDGELQQWRVLPWLSTGSGEPAMEGASIDERRHL